MTDTQFNRARRIGTQRLHRLLTAQIAQLKTHYAERKKVVRDREEIERDHRVKIQRSFHRVILSCLVTVC